MKKILLNILLLVVIGKLAAQVPVPDSVRVMRDTTAPRPSQDLPVLSDTTQYNDTTIVQTEAGRDTLVKKRVHSPRRATLRSLVVPGLGQIYNKKYWKVPIVYAAVGIPVYLFFDNRKWYNRTRYALGVISDTNQYNNPAARDKVDPTMKYYVDNKLVGPLVNYRNDRRKDMDYSILFTLLMWGLNVVDATVDAHLKDFDVSEDLSMKIRPVMNNSNMTPGIALVINFK
jgi:hypothetical protein